MNDDPLAPISRLPVHPDVDIFACSLVAAIVHLAAVHVWCIARSCRGSQLFAAGHLTLWVVWLPCLAGEALSNADFRKLMNQPKEAGPANAPETGANKKTKEYDSERRKKKR